MKPIDFATVSVHETKSLFGGEETTTGSVSSPEGKKALSFTIINFLHTLPKELIDLRGVPSRNPDGGEGRGLLAEARAVFDTEGSPELTVRIMTEFVEFRGSHIVYRTLTLWDGEHGEIPTSLPAFLEIPTTSLHVTLSLEGFSTVVGSGLLGFAPVVTGSLTVKEADDIYMVVSTKQRGLFSGKLPVELQGLVGEIWTAGL